MTDARGEPKENEGAGRHRAAFVLPELFVKAFARKDFSTEET